MPKRDSLRPFPEALPKHAEVLRVASGEVKEITFSPKPGATAMTIAVAAGGQLTLMVAATYAADAYRLLGIEAAIGKDAMLHVIDRAMGGARLETRVVFSLQASGAEAKFTGMYHGRELEHHACHVIVDHAVPHTRGDVYVRGVYEQEARSVFTGLIKVAPNAQQTRSYYRDDVLLLDNAIAESLPTLEIEANDVKASHGSTTSRMNDEQLFYLMSRGLPQAHARNLIVAGFLTPALKRVPEALCKPFLPTD
ncbi:MAG: SufD family Fe-S cluster assembly protein [Patescibacteria group bacterium]